MTDMNGVSAESNVDEKPSGGRASRKRRSILLSAALVIVLGVAGFVVVDRSGDTSRQGTVTSGHYWRDVSVGFDHMLGLDQAGHAWAWGENDRGQLGDGTTTAHANPAMVSGGHSFKSIEAGDEFSVGLDTGGKIWTWGGNYDHQLGEGADLVYERLVPGEVARPSSRGPITFPIPTYTQISAGAHHVVALDENGRAYAWGSNRSGEVGVGEMSISDVGVSGQCVSESDGVDAPMRVKDDADLVLNMRFSVISAGANFTVGITKDTNSLFAWGSQIGTYLGLGTDYQTRDKVCQPRRVSKLTTDGNPDQNFTSVAAGEVGYMTRGASGSYFVSGPDTTSSKAKSTTHFSSYTAGKLIAGVMDNGKIQIAFGWHGDVVVPGGNSSFTKVRTYQLESSPNTTNFSDFQRFAAIDDKGRIWVFDELVNENTMDDQVVLTRVPDPS
ncbi:MAG: hypothetical protein WCL08_02930 [Verrucomicrobiota bacterium]